MSEVRASVAGWSERLTRPLTPTEHARIRIGLALMPVLGWLIVSWSTYTLDTLPPGRLDGSGHIKGHDFIHFYVLGEIAREHATHELYSLEAQSARNDRMVPEYEVRYLPIHGPQVAMFLAPLAMSSYVTALTIWLAGTALLYAICCTLIVSTLPNLRPYAWVVALCCLGFPALYGVISAGQTTAWALLWLTLAYLSLRSDRRFLAGLFLGTLVYKPTLGLVLPFVFLSAREWRVVVGAAVAIALQFGVPLIYFGPATLVEYVANFRNALVGIDALESQPWQMHSLRSFFSNSLPWPTLASSLYYASAACVIAFAVRAWLSRLSLDVRYAVLLIATVLVSPHVYTYELLVVAPAFLLAASIAVERGRQSRYLSVLLYVAYFMPALPGFALATHVQWSVPVLAALMVALTRFPQSEVNAIVGAQA